MNISKYVICVDNGALSEEELIIKDKLVEYKQQKPDDFAKFLIIIEETQCPMNIYVLGEVVAKWRGKFLAKNEPSLTFVALALKPCYKGRGYTIAHIIRTINCRLISSILKTIPRTLL